MSTWPFPRTSWLECDELYPALSQPEPVVQPGSGDEGDDLSDGFGAERQGSPCDACGARIGVDDCGTCGLRKVIELALSCPRIDCPCASFQACRGARH